MRIRKLVLLASVVALPAFAQVQISVQLPTITFNAPPPLVVVQPGVQVVEDNDEEVFFVDNYYWVRHGPRWYRTKDHRGGWVVVDGPGVPASLVRLPPGQYRRFKHEVREERREDRRELEKGQGHKEKHGKH
jgi:hypothetical protein